MIPWFLITLSSSLINSSVSRYLTQLLSALQMKDMTCLSNGWNWPCTNCCPSLRIYLWQQILSFFPAIILFTQQESGKSIREQTYPKQQRSDALCTTFAWQQSAEASSLSWMIPSQQMNPTWAMVWLPQQTALSSGRAWMTPSQHIWTLVLMPYVPQHPGVPCGLGLTTESQHISMSLLKAAEPQHSILSLIRSCMIPWQHIFRVLSMASWPQQSGLTPSPTGLGAMCPSQHNWVYWSMPMPLQHTELLLGREWILPWQQIWYSRSKASLPQQSGVWHGRYLHENIHSSQMLAPNQFKLLFRSFVPCFLFTAKVCCSVNDFSATTVWLSELTVW